MANERLAWNLENNGLLAKQQCGYRAKRFTVDPLVRLETPIWGALIENQHLVAVFFTSKSHIILCLKWCHLNDMSLRGNLPILIANFLSDRTFQVHSRTILSDHIFLKEGVPQAAILSTMLFNIKINIKNNILTQVDPGVECSLYVNDFVIMYKSPTIDAMEMELQHTINRLENRPL